MNKLNNLITKIVEAIKSGDAVKKIRNIIEKKKKLFLIISILIFIGFVIILNQGNDTNYDYISKPRSLATKAMARYDKIIIAKGKKVANIIRKLPSNKSYLGYLIKVNDTIDKDILLEIKKALQEHSNTYHYSPIVLDFSCATGLLEFGNSGAFKECNALYGIYLPESVTSINSYAFYGCKDLRYIKIPDSVTKIGDEAFFGCNEELIIDTTAINVSTVIDNLSSGKYYIGVNGTINTKTIAEIKKALQKKDTSDISLDLSYTTDLTAIPENAFRNCDCLIGLKIPDSVTSIGNYAFYDCDNLLYYSYDDALYIGCEENPYIALVTAQNSNIASCEIKYGTRIIMNNAFYNCYYLKSVDIPYSIEIIGEAAFYSCNSLNTVKYHGNEDSWSEINIGKNNYKLINVPMFKYLGGPQ